MILPPQNLNPLGAFPLGRMISSSIILPPIILPIHNDLDRIDL